MAPPSRLSHHPPPTTRRLAAIWFADLVGYSALASRDEGTALQRVAHFQAACRTAVSRRGRIVKFTGDGALAEFSSTAEAVEAAIDMRAEFAKVVAGEQGGQLIRVGVHVSDITAHADGDIYGDGINTAARIQQVAAGGEILVSADVWRQLRASRGLHFRRLGRRTLRGLQDPVELFAVARDERAEDSSGAPRAGDFFRELKRRLGLLPPLLPPGASPAHFPQEWPGMNGVGSQNPVEVGRPAVLGLPTDLDPFLGRAPELARLGQLIAEGGSRLVTITGPGGIGKTRFALQVALEQAADFADGAVFVPLAGETSGTTLLPRLAEQLGIATNAATDVGPQVVDYLRSRELLIVLDNFEELVTSAGSLADLLEQAPRCVLLVTSRVRLGLKSETGFPLLGLQVGDGPRDGLGDAGGLFVASALRADPGFILAAGDDIHIRQLCAYLKGIPLAIELAATWTRVLPCSEILAEVKRNYNFLSNAWPDVPARHRSLEAVFNSSWLMLSPDERRVFSRLTIFEGGFGRAAAEEVAGASFRLISALIDKSLLRRVDGDRFEMLEILRQYGQERLREESGEEGAIADAHGAFFLGCLEEAGSVAAEDVGALDSVGADLENARAAWRWGLRSAALAQLDRGLTGLFELLDGRGRLREGEELMAETESAITALGRTLSGSRGGLPGENEPAPLEDGLPPAVGGLTALLLMRVRIRRGILSAHLGRYETAVRLLEESLEEARRLDVPGETALVLENLARLALQHGDYDNAGQLYGESHALHEQVGNVRGAGRAMLGSGNVAYSGGEHELAEKLYRQSLHMLREVNDRAGLASALCNLGILASSRGHFAAARPLLEESLAIASASQNHRGTATALLNLGVTAYLTPDLAAAEEYLTQGIELCREMGLRRHLAPFSNLLGKVYADSARPLPAVQAYREALQASLEISEIPVLLETMLLSAGILREIDPVAAQHAAAFVAAHPAGERSSRKSAADLAAELGSRAPGSAAEAQSEQIVDINDVTGAVGRLLESLAPSEQLSAKHPSHHLHAENQP